MKNTYLFLRHAETIKDPNKHPKDWDLTTDSLEQVHKYISEGKFRDVTKIYASTEPKAVATGKPISQDLNLSINEMEEFVEVKREKTFLSDEEFLAQKKRELENLEKIENGVESGRSALERFLRGIEILESEFTGETILIITHGTVLSIYFADMLGKQNEIFERWQNLRFCALGQIEKGIVVKDIV